MTIYLGEDDIFRDLAESKTDVFHHVVKIPAARSRKWRESQLNTSLCHRQRMREEDCGTEEGNKEKKTSRPREKYAFSLFNKHKVSSGQKKSSPTHRINM